MAEHSNNYTLTAQQKGIWLIEKLNSGTSINVVAGTIRITQKVDFTVLEKAVQMVIKNNEAFRLRIGLKDGQPYQYTADYKSLKLDFHDFSQPGLDGFRKWEQTETRMPFVLMDSDLFRFVLFKVSDTDGGFYIKTHHLISDAWTMNLISNQVLEYYSAMAGRIPVEVKTHPSYIEYLSREREYENSKRFLLDSGFWRTKLGSMPEIKGLKANDAAYGDTFAVRKTYIIPNEQSNGLYSFCTANKLSVYSLFLSVLSVYMGRVLANGKVVVGAPVLNRANVREKDMVGMFVRTIPVIIDLDYSLDILSFVQGVTRDWMQYLKHYQYPFDLMIKELKEQKKESDKFYDILLSYQNAKLIKNKNNICDFHAEWHFNGHQANSLSIHINDRENEGILTMDYDFLPCLFSEKEIEQIHQSLLMLIDNAIRCPSRKLGELELVSEDEKTHILFDFNRTQTQYAIGKTVHQLFEEQVKKTPDQTAVIFGDERLTYHELNKKSNQLARALRKMGVGPDFIVGLMVNRSLELMIGIMGILKAGGAYLPIDPEYPGERVRYMLEDSGTRILLTHDGLEGKTPEGITTVNIKDASIYAGRHSNVESVSSSSSLAYVIYTSGSTGKPKGVTLEHRSVNNFIQGMREKINFSKDMTIISVTTISFDIFITETILPLTAGLKVVIASEDEQTSPKLLSEAILRNNVDIFQATPSRLTLIVNDKNGVKGLSRLTQLIVGGEAFPEVLLEKLKGCTAAKILNGYGPTETTIYSTAADLTSERKINIGRPVANTQLFILDDYLQFLPVGVAGQLYIGGDGLARGYLNRPDLTDERFIPNPHIPGEKMYKTGDLAKWLPNGEVELLGRTDQQVKIRGFRVETGEVESALLEHPSVKEAAVVLKEDKKGEKFLCAFYVSDTEPAHTGLRKFLAASLPGYMVPGAFVKVDSMPLTPNGKINRMALPEVPERVNVMADAVPPRNDTEELLAGIWRRILDIEGISIYDNFFELGADSLNIITFITRLYDEIKVELNLREIYQVPCIAELSEYIASKKNDANGLDVPGAEWDIQVRKADKKDDYPLSSGQRRLYLLSQMDAGSVNYNICWVGFIEGEIDLPRLENAFSKLIHRHEALRTAFDVLDGYPVQRVHDRVDFKIGVTDGNAEELDSIIDGFIQPFDLSRAPLIKVHVVRLEKEKSALLFDMHHIISDGASINIMLKELNGLYHGDALVPVKTQYRDYAVWQKDYLKTRKLKEQEKYWLELFSDEASILNMPTDYPRPALQSFEGSIYRFDIEKDLSDRLKTLAAQSGSTLYMVLLSAYSILLSKYTGQEDIVVGSPVAGRINSEFENTMGMFVNTLAMRNYPAGGKTFSGFLEEVRENTLKALDNQNYPFEELISKLKIKRDPGRNPLFDTLFVLQNFDISNILLGGLRVQPYAFDSKASKFDLTLEAVHKGSMLSFNMEYCTKLFKRETIERLARHFINILNAIAKDSQVRISRLDYLTGEEKHRLLYDFNDTRRDYPADKVIHQLFEEQVERTPDKVAACFKNNSLTYRELNEKANQLAGWLRKEGVGPNVLVGLMLHRGLEMVTGVMAILKAGGAYLPIDPEFPEERIRYMLEESGMEILLLEKGLSSLVNFKNKIPFSLEDMPASEDTHNPANINAPGDLLYVIYTSGSTGKPKGVMLEHRNLVNLMNFQFTKTNIDFNSRVLQFTTISFDVCYQEIFSTLLSGGELFIVDSRTKRDAEDLLEFIRKNGINVLFIPPSYLKMIVNTEGFIEKLSKTLKHIIIAGEQLIISEQFKQYLQENKVYLHNHYGPSETHVVTTYTVEPGPGIPELPPIGKPISNTRIYILDKEYYPVPEQVTGELYIGGDNVGRGYLNKPAMTQERFLPDPFADGERMYKTGDLARWMSDGNIEFLGRADNQVKIRGFRIELGEIESCLLNHDGIKEAAVIARKDSRGYNQISAFVVVQGEVSPFQMRYYISDRLPDYMVPAYFTVLDSMPMTPSGKIDRKALEGYTANEERHEEFEEPVNDTERKLVDIWCKVLNKEAISVTDNFFEIGGDSLAIILVQARTYAYGWGLKAQDFYMHQTIRELARKITGAAGLADSGYISALDEAAAVGRELGILYERSGKKGGGAVENVLITGATGYLGIHILNELLSSTGLKAYCLIRGADEAASRAHLLERLNYYFPGRHGKLFNERFFAVKGDITRAQFGLPEDEYTALGEKIDVVIHSAAIVKHFGVYDDFEKVNVLGTRETLDFASRFGTAFRHISSTGISGNNYLNYPEAGEKKAVFTEDDFYIGQNYRDNVYVRSKFEAESLVFSALKNGLDASIFRIGYLTGRYSDGRFQQNIEENAFYNKLKLIAKTGVAPESIFRQEVEFTPVDCCSKAIVKLLEAKGCGHVFHMFNHNSIKAEDLIGMIAGYSEEGIRILGMDAYKEFMMKAVGDESKQEFLKGLIYDLDYTDKFEEGLFRLLDSTKTQVCLKETGFEWPRIDQKYIDKIYAYMIEVGFI